MNPDNKNLIGQLVSLRMHSPYLPNGQKDMQDAFLVLDAHEHMLVGYFTDEIDQELFASPAMPLLIGEIHYSIIGIAEGKGVLLKMEQIVEKVLRAGRLILIADEQRQKYFRIYSPVMELVKRALRHVEQQESQDQPEPDTSCTGCYSEAEDSSSEEIIIHVPQGYRLKTITLEEGSHDED